MRPHRAGEIDYYEELGVDRDAGPEDIRESFRALVRLLHPDQQRDEQLRSIAEIQLRKVNRIYAVLSDPERRRMYDESLEESFQPPPIVFRAGPNIDAKQFVSRIVWIGAAVLGVAIVIWFATDPPSTPLFSPAERVSASSRAARESTAVHSDTQAESGPPSSDSGSALSSPSGSASSNSSGSAFSSYEGEIAQLRSALRAAQRERDQAKQDLAQLQARQELRPHAAPPASNTSNGPAPTSASVPDLAPTHIVSAPPPRPAVVPALPPPSRSLRPLGSDPHQFAGFWFFARSSQTNRTINLYPPEFIEATLTEQNGVVYGKFRSRYRIVDRAISPDVNFEFSGTPSAAGAITSPWFGPGGAKGQLTLQLTSENDIKIDWTASEVGHVQGLVSGTATLTRRLE
jgi:curved DNA-binding protein CbpA